jgi:multidrug efflux system outer membrane protein
VLVAFQDVEDGLGDLDYLSRQTGVLRAAAAAAERAVSLSNLRYRAGVTDYFEVIDAERTALDDELLLSQVRGGQFVSTVVLIKAIGGGW